MANLYSSPTDLTAVLANIAVINDTKLSAENLAYMGIAGQPAFQDYFANVATLAVPDVLKWNVVVDNDALVRVLNGQLLIACQLLAGTVNLNDAYINTYNLYAWDNSALLKNYLVFEAYIYCGDLTGQYGYGFKQASMATDSQSYNGIPDSVSIFCDNDVVHFNTSDGGALEFTDISAFIAEGTYDRIQFFCTPTAITLYINGVLRATHITNIPNESLNIGFASRNANAIQTDFRIQLSKVNVI